MQKITITAVTGSRNYTALNSTGYVVTVLRHEDSNLPVFMVRMPSSRIIPVSEEYEDFILWAKCGNCQEECDVRELSDDFYQECKKCVDWFNGFTDTIGYPLKKYNQKPQESTSGDSLKLAKEAMINQKRRK
jgi:hypothetical protein